jgi:hypothetical protein
MNGWAIFRRNPERIQSSSPALPVRAVRASNGYAG